MADTAEKLVLSTSELKLQFEDSVKASELKKFREYAATQRNFKFPQAKIHARTNETEKLLEVNIEVEYNGTQYHFESIKPSHCDIVYKYLDSQSIVRCKFADGKTRTVQESADRVKLWSSRYSLQDDKGVAKLPNPFSSFAVFDAENRQFLGVSVLGGGEKAGTSEMAYLNRADTWSHLPDEIVKTYEVDTADKKKVKEYKGVATTEVCTMLQYAKFLKDNKHKVNGNDLDAVVMTARVDNPGSWKAGAKGGMDVYDIDVNKKFGPDLRYQMMRKV